MEPLGLGKTGGGMNCGNLGEGAGGRDFPGDTNTYIENSLRLFRLLGYLSRNIICSERQTVFWKRNWGIFGQVIWLDQSRASENIWWIINKKYPQSGTKIYYDILSVDITFFSEILAWEKLWASWNRYCPRTNDLSIVRHQRAIVFFLQIFFFAAGTDLKVRE